MTAAVSLVMLTSIAFLGNAVAELQAADRIPTTPLPGWPAQFPIYVSEATGYRPTVQTVLAQSRPRAAVPARRSLGVPREPGVDPSAQRGDAGPGPGATAAA